MEQLTPLFNATALTVAIFAAWAIGTVAAKVLFGAEADGASMIPAFGFAVLYALFDAKDVLDEIGERVAGDFRCGSEEGCQESEQSTEGR